MLVFCCWKGGGISCGSGGFDGKVAQVQSSLAGKYGIAFSGNRPSKSSHFLIKVGHGADVLGCLEPAPQETQEGGLSHLSDR